MCLLLLSFSLQSYDIGQIVSARLKAARALQSNPNNVEALTVLHHSQKQVSGVERTFLLCNIQFKLLLNRWTRDTFEQCLDILIPRGMIEDPIH